MLITNKQKEIIKKGLEDYKFMKELIDTREFKNLKDAEKFLNRLKDLDISAIDEQEGYLDFFYKDLSLYLNIKEDGIKLGNCISVWDKEKEEYIFECNSVEYIEENLKKDKYEMIKETLDLIKDYEEKGVIYTHSKNELVKFIEQSL